MAKRKKGKRTTNASKASYNGKKKGEATSSESRGGNVKSGGIVKGTDALGRKFTRDTKKQKRDALTGRWAFNTSSKVKEIAKKRGKTGEGFSAGRKAVTQKKTTTAAKVSKASLKNQLQKKLTEITANKEKDTKKAGSAVVDKKKEVKKNLDENPKTKSDGTVKKGDEKTNS